MITDKQIYVLFGEAANYTDPDAFASDAALAALDGDNADQEIDIELFEQLRILWHVSADPFRVLLKSMGLTQSQCSTRFCIPLRTVQHWAEGSRSSPPYLRLMMAEATGMLKIR